MRRDRPAGKSRRDTRQLLFEQRDDVIAADGSTEVCGSSMRENRADVLFAVLVAAFDKVSVLPLISVIVRLPGYRR